MFPEKTLMRTQWINPHEALYASPLHAAHIETLRDYGEWASSARRLGFSKEKGARNRKMELVAFSRAEMNGNFRTFQATASERKWNFPAPQAGRLCLKLSIWCAGLAFNLVINLEGHCMNTRFHLVSLKALSSWFIRSLFMQGDWIGKSWMIGFWQKRQVKFKEEIRNLLRHSIYLLWFINNINWRLIGPLRTVQKEGLSSMWHLPVSLPFLFLSSLLDEVN